MTSGASHRKASDAGYQSVSIQALPSNHTVKMTLEIFHIPECCFETRLDAKHCIYGVLPLLRSKDMEDYYIESDYSRPTLELYKPLITSDMSLAAIPIDKDHLYIFAELLAQHLDLGEVKEPIMEYVESCSGLRCEGKPLPFITNELVSNGSFQGLAY
jgi:hypothetical protein